VSVLAEGSRKAMQPTVYVIEDDPSLANALSLMLAALGYEHETFESGEDFLGSPIVRNSGGPGDTLDPRPTVILLDIRLRTMSGIEVFYELRRQDLTKRWPVIFLTGHGDMETAVSVLKEGAYDFLTKPFDSEALIEKIMFAGAKSADKIDDLIFIRGLNQLLSTLTDKEREVMERIVKGETSKQIADDLGNSSRTVEIHRAKIFDKLKVENAVELSRVIEKYRILGGRALDL